MTTDPDTKHGRPGAQPSEGERTPDGAQRSGDSGGSRVPRGGTWGFQLPRGRLLPAGIMAIVVVFAAAMMPAPWPAPERAVESRTERVEVHLDEQQLDNIHTMSWDTPSDAAAVVAELDGHTQPVSVGPGQHGRAVFQFPGGHTQHTGSLTLQRRDGSKIVVRF